MPPLKSWLDIPAGSHFSLRNLPFGIIISAADDGAPRAGVAVGDHVLDLRAFAAGGGFARLAGLGDDELTVFAQPTLNGFAALGRPRTGAVRVYLQDVLRANGPYPDLLRDNAGLRERALLPRAAVRAARLPLRIGDYSDFYAGMHHAFSVGALLRGPDHALQPNYTHMPVGYHGRASSVVVSGTPVRRPRGQVLPRHQQQSEPELAPSRRLDLELELAAFVGRASEMGRPVGMAEAPEYVFGYVLMNDWSARDAQAWEYVPLGPFTSKSFATTVSPWVVLADALEPFRTRGLESGVEVLRYLRQERPDTVFDIKLQVDLETESGSSVNLTKTNASNLLWSFEQMIAHQTITGCNLNVGDLLGSGTISGTEKGTQGSMIEATNGGRESLQLDGGETRVFLKDGDTVRITGYAGDEESGLVGFGECLGQVWPAC